MKKYRMSHFVRPVLLLVGLALLGGGLALAAAESQAPVTVGTTTIVSISTSGVVGNAESISPSISDNGRYVAFESLASNLVIGDTNDKWDVFVHDRQTGATERLSEAADGTQGNSNSYAASISADGRYIVFTSTADNLISGEISSGANVYLKDRSTGQIELISSIPTGEAEGCAGHGSAISNNLRYVAFYAACDRITNDDSNGKHDVYLRDRWSGQTRRVSIGPGGVQGDHDSWGPIGISADGSEVFFSSWSTNLVSEDTNNTLDAFVHNWETGVTEILSVSTDNDQGDYDTGSNNPSADGQIVALGSNASTLVDDDNNFSGDVFIRNRATGETRRVSISSDGGEAYDQSLMGAISPEGRFVTFYSHSSELVVHDTNNVPDIFVHDTQTGRTNRVSISSNGTQANDESFYTMDIARDGRAIAFVSKATNLVSGVGDTNNTWDIFIHEHAPCHSLTTGFYGSGDFPNPLPEHSIGCEPGTYHGGEQITLEANPAAGWQVTGWSGTNNDDSTNTINTVTMPANDYTVDVIYERIPHTITPTYTPTATATPTLTPTATSTPTGTRISSTSHRLFAPLALSVPNLTPPPPACFAGPNEKNPNNDAAQANINGPLCHGATIRGLPDDTFDYFMLDTTQPGRVAATVSDHYAEGVQLALYFGGCCSVSQRVDIDTGQADGLNVSYTAGQPGRFYIAIYAATPKPGETRPYTLQVEFP